MTTAWNVYAKELYHHGHGYPLWVPDLDPNRSQWEVEIADVGWVRDGTFNHLLRCKGTQGANDQPHDVLSDDYVPFNPPNLVISGPREKITQPVLYSRSINNVEISGGVSVNVPLAAPTPGGNIKFQCAEDKGALLLLSPNGEETFIESKRHIVTYMREHLDHWERLANSTLGLELEREDIFFVCGVTKTSRWGVAAFSGTQRGAQGRISCDFGALGSAGMSLNISQTSVPGSWYRTGPPGVRRSPARSFASAPAIVPYGASGTQPPFGTGSSTSVSSYGTAAGLSTASLPTDSAQFTSGMPVLTMPQAAPGVPDKADQCIFFHYYKAKRRFFGLFERLEAGAGPHELPPSADDGFPNAELLAQGGDPADDDYDFTMPTGDSKPYDPVVDVLDYILLTNKEAKLAIASDLDLYALFKDQEFPEDVAAELARLQPAVELDENDVGTLSVDITYNRKRVGEEPEGYPSKKRATSPGDTPRSGDPSESMDVDPQPGTFLSGDAGHGISHPSTSPPQDLPAPDTGKEPVRHVIGDPSTHDGSVTALAYSADGRYLATGAEDTCVIVWYAREGAVKRKLAAHDDTISALAFSPSGAILASASDYGPIKLWQVEALDQEPQVVDSGVFVRSLAFTPDGSKLLGGASDGQFIMWNVGNLARVNIVHHAAVVSFIIFSADGSMMATGGTESICRVWEVASLDSGTPKLELKGHRGMVSSASFSPDGRRIITGSDDASCRIWSTESGDALVNLHEHTGPVWAVAFSPDGTRVVSGSSDTTVKVCDAWTGERRLSLHAHENMINSVAYSHDGLYIASASSDNTVRLWDAERGNLVRTYNEHSDNVTSVRFSPDSKTLASGAHDGTVYIRQLQLAAPSNVTT